MMGTTIAKACLSLKGHTLGMTKESKDSQLFLLLQHSSGGYSTHLVVFLAASSLIYFLFTNNETVFVSTTRKALKVVSEVEIFIKGVKRHATERIQCAGTYSIEHIQQYDLSGTVGNVPDKMAVSTKLE